MECHVLELPPIQTNTYLLTDVERGEAVLFDAPWTALDHVQPLLGAENLKLTAVVLTHGHWDHTLGAPDLKATGSPIWAHEGDRAMIEDAEAQRPFALPGLDLQPVQVDRWLEVGETVTLIGLQAEVLHVPGHSPGSIALHFVGENLLISGDVLFASGVGRTDLPGSNPSDLERSILDVLYKLPDQTIVCPGHGPRTTIGHEKATNPFFRA